MHIQHHCQASAAGRSSASPAGAATAAAAAGESARERCPRCGSEVGWAKPDPKIFHREDMRAALAVRDVATVYRILQSYGWSQRRIALLTQQSQSEVSEILGGRRVTSYAVLVRIADALGVARGWMGLAHDDSAPAGPSAPAPGGR